MSQTYTIRVRLRLELNGIGSLSMFRLATLFLLLVLLGGSGFSFPDLVADRADETLFMPPIDRPPEGLQDTQLRRRHDNIDTAADDRVRSELERRIDALALHRP